MLTVYSDSKYEPQSSIDMRRGYSLIHLNLNFFKIRDLWNSAAHKVTIGEAIKVLNWFIHI